MTWHPDDYLRYEKLRLRPAIDLIRESTAWLDLDRNRPGVVYDLGCGTGNVTLRLEERLNEMGFEHRIVGLDSSQDMLERARGNLSAEQEGLIEFRHESIEHFDPEVPPALIFSNAALHWLPKHHTLLPGLVQRLEPGGVFAAQMPQSWGCASHEAMREVLVEQRLGQHSLHDRLATCLVQSPEFYEESLRGHCQEVSIWSTTYYQCIGGDDPAEHPVLTWVRSTGLRPILKALEPKELATFMTAYEEALNHHYPIRSDGTALYPFPRLFIVARR